MPKATDKKPKSRLRQAAGKFRRGEETLGRAFWLWGIGGNLLYIIMFFALIALTSTHSHDLPYSGELFSIENIRKFWADMAKLIVLLLFWGVSIVYIIWSYAGGLRTAKTSQSTWKIPAITTATLLLVIGIGLWVYYHWLIYMLGFTILHHSGPMAYPILFELQHYLFYSE